MDYIHATLIRRYRRFLADVELDDRRIVVAHCPNPGRIPAVCIPGGRVRLLARPGNKLGFRWIQSLTPHGWANIDTLLANAQLKTYFRSNTLPNWQPIIDVRSEVTFGDSRFDFVLTHEDGSQRIVEAKTVSWYDTESDRLLFPDSPSVRAVKHLQNLTRLAKSGEQCTVLYVISYPVIGTVQPATHIDPDYAKAVKTAKKAGVEFSQIRQVITDSDVGLAL